MPCVVVLKYIVQFQHSGVQFRAVLYSDFNRDQREVLVRGMFSKPQANATQNRSEFYERD
jgi:hypothetical protein